MAQQSAERTPFDGLYTAPQTRVRVGRSRRLNLVVAGAGSPTVVFAPGLINTAIEWSRVQPAIATQACTAAFDKAGMGFSDPGPNPRTATAIVKDLRAALRGAGLAPPCVLVGWSAGGMQMRLFAFLYPAEVAGLVMVDPSSEHQHRRLAEATGAPLPDRAAELATYARLARLAGAGRLQPGSPYHQRAVGFPSLALAPALNAARAAHRTSAAFWRAVRSESEAMWGAEGQSTSAEQVLAARRSLGDMPLVVLTAGGNASPRPGESAQMAAARHKAWKAMHEEIAALSTRGVRHTIDGAGHAILLERPDVVIDAIGDVLARARRLGLRFSRSPARSGRHRSRPWPRGIR